MPSARNIVVAHAHSTDAATGGGASVPMCRKCRRLVDHRCANALAHPGYHNAPVDAWSGGRAELLVIGLAPGLHGANRTGRPFTGDASGQALFNALVDSGFAERAPGRAGVRLRRCTITNAVRCVPPGNRPIAAEFGNCRPYLEADIKAFHPPGARRPRCIVTLGRDAHAATMRALAATPGDFRHGMEQPLAFRLWLLTSYHPSRRNMNNGKLTQEMLDAVFARARHIVDGGNLD